MPDETVTMRYAWVDITASSYHGMPEQVHHNLTRGAHPEAILDPANLRGLPARTHRAKHEGADIEPEVDLHVVW